MDRYEAGEKLESHIGPYLNERGFELFELIHRFEGESLFVRLLVDKPQGGITVDEITALNSQIGTLLDETGIVSGRYILEVSSPGADRPLIGKKDFQRCINRRVRIFVREPLGGKWEIEGTIIQVDETSFVCDRGVEQTSVPFAQIAKAKQIIP